MSAVFLCDGCGRQVYGDFDGERWIAPRNWVARPLQDWEINGCNSTCLDRALDRQKLTPTGGYRVGSQSSDRLAIPVQAAPFVDPLGGPS